VSVRAPASVRERILLPLAALLLVFVVAFTGIAYFSVERERLHRLAEAERAATMLFRDAVDRDARAMAGSLQLLARDNRLRAALGDEDRDGMLRFRFPYSGNSSLAPL
jgi:hypothetical protein